MNAFFNEAFRILGPNINNFIRVCIKPCRINGVKIRKGTKVNVCVGGIHRSNKIFERATEFWPDRFEHEGEKDEKCDISPMPKKELLLKKRNAEYIPFSFGRRACIGAFFGEIVVKIMLRSVIRKFEWKADEVADRRIAFFSSEMETIKLLMRPLSEQESF